MLLKSFAAETTQGPYLQINEDSYDFDLEKQVYMVFDGFGGVGIGNVGVEKIKNDIKKFYQNFTEDPNSTMPFFYSPQYLPEGNAVINASLKAHTNLYKNNVTKDISGRAGSSGIVVSQSESILSILSVGSCRCYLVRRGKIEKVFIEDSYNLLTRDDKSHYSRIPSSAFGMYSDLYYQLKEIRLKTDDKIVIMSDGIYERVDEAEILAEVSKSVLNVKTKIRNLCDIANQRGNLDNQTCIVLEY